MKIIAAIEDPKVIRKILDHNELQAKHPSLQPARGPPSPESHFEDVFKQCSFDLNFIKRGTIAQPYFFRS